MGLIVFAAVLLHNVLGYILGYLTGKALKMPESYNRTMAVEIGTQSAGLASGMSAKFFAPEAALPGACAAVLHNITGAIFSAVARRFPTEQQATLETVENIEATASVKASLFLSLSLTEIGGHYPSRNFKPRGVTLVTGGLELCPNKTTTSRDPDV